MNDSNDSSVSTSFSDSRHPVSRGSTYAGLTGKTAIITGAGSGIGLAMAQGFARNGANLLLVDIDSAALVAARSALLDAFPASRVESQHASVTDEAAMQAAFAYASQCFGRVDVLLNNAGVSLNKSSLDITLAEWRRAMDINVTSVFFCAQLAARYMGEGASIINTASMWGVSHAAERTAYCATKAAVVSMTKCLAVEWAARGIRVNAIGPGYTRTSLVDTLRRNGRLDVDALCKRTPLQRLGEPQDMAELALFLASSSAGFITGQVFVADGGWTANGF